MGKTGTRTGTTRRTLAAAMALILAVGTLFAVIPAYAADGNGVAVTRDYAGAGGTKLNVMKLDGANEYTARVVFAHGAPGNAVSVNTIIEDAKTRGNLVAAFSGTFFSAYDGSNKTDGTVYNDGAFVKGSNEGPPIGIMQLKDGSFRATNYDNAPPTSEVVTSAWGTPVLIRDGANYFAENPKQPYTPAEGGAQRTLVGVTADNSLVVAEGATTFANAAQSMLALGCTEAIAMDGGASSFVWANGETIQQAGRNLNNIVCVYLTGEAAVESPAPAEPAETPPAPETTAAAPAEPLIDGPNADPTASTVYVDGTETAFEAYTIDGSNYFKLRDLAMALDGSAKRFEVGYDAQEDAIALTSGTGYTAAGGELAAGDGRPKTAAPTTSRVFLDGRELNLTAYNINGNNFFKLRDLMAAIDVYVGYDEATQAITLNTGRAYREPAAQTEATVQDVLKNLGDADGIHPLRGQTWAKDGDTLYFFGSRKQICKYDMNTKKTRVLSENHRDDGINSIPEFIGVIDDKLYYVYDNTIWIMNTDGSVDETLDDTIRCDGNVLFVDGWIYYTCGSYVAVNESDVGTWKIKTDGSGKKRISHDVAGIAGSMIISDGWIYYLDGNNGGDSEQFLFINHPGAHISRDGFAITKMTVEGDNKGVIKGENGDTIYANDIRGVEDGTVYYAYRSSINNIEVYWRYSMVGINGFREGVDGLSVQVPQGIMLDGWFYYLDISYTVLCRKNLDGDDIPICEGPTGTCIIGDRIYADIASQNAYKNGEYDEHWFDDVVLGTNVIMSLDGEILEYITEK